MDLVFSALYERQDRNETDRFERQRLLDQNLRMRWCSAASTSAVKIEITFGAKGEKEKLQ